MNKSDRLIEEIRNFLNENKIDRRADDKIRNLCRECKTKERQLQELRDFKSKYEKDNEQFKKDYREKIDKTINEKVNERLNERLKKAVEQETAELKDDKWNLIDENGNLKLKIREIEQELEKQKAINEKWKAMFTEQAMANAKLINKEEN